MQELIKTNAAKGGTGLRRKTPLRRTGFRRPDAPAQGSALSSMLFPDRKTSLPRQRTSLKRTPLKRKTPLRAKPKPPKPKRISLSSAKAKAWKAFSEYIRLRDALLTTGTTERAICCSCGKEYPAFGVGCVQAGHFIPGRHAANLLDERGCHAQCYVCNVRMKGNWARYFDFMLTRYGQSVIDELLAQDKVILQRTPQEYLAHAARFATKTQLLRQRAVARSQADKASP